MCGMRALRKAALLQEWVWGTSTKVSSHTGTNQYTRVAHYMCTDAFADVSHERRTPQSAMVYALPAPSGICPQEKAAISG